MNKTVKKDNVKHESKYLDLISYFISCIDKKLFYLVSPILIVSFLNIWLDNNMRLNYFLELILAYFVIMITLTLICYKYKKKHKQMIIRRIHLVEKTKTFGIMFIITIIEMLMLGWTQVLSVIN